MVMEIKQLLVEKTMAEIIAERDAMICNLFMENETLKKALAELSAKLEKQDGDKASQES